MTAILSRFRKVRVSDLREGLRDPAQAEHPTPPKHIEVNGHKIHLRMVQQIIWLGILGYIAICVVSALYYGITQVDYGTIAGHHIWLKPHWDNLLHNVWWGLWRHGYRNMMEGVVAVPLAKSLLGSGWKKRPFLRLSTPKLALRMVEILVEGLVLITAGLWVASFGVAMLLHHSTHVAFITPSPRIVELEYFVIGLVIGQVIHRRWRAAGNTIQLFFVEKGASFARNTGRLPVWVRRPLQPPVMRERVAWTVDANVPVHEHGKWIRVVAPAFLAINFLLFVWGVYVREVIAKG